MRILVAETEAECRVGLVRWIENAGHTPIEALAAREVMEHCHGNRCPDLLFISKQLAELSGFEVVKQIRQLGGNPIWVPVLMLSSDVWSEAEILEGLQVGSDDFLVKPITELMFRVKIRSAERQHHLREEVFSVAHNLVVANRALESLVTQDALTGVMSVRSFEEMLETEWSKARRGNSTLAWILLNIDHFQSYNQSYGVEAGDLCLKKVANVLQAVLTPGSLPLARMGGSSFSALLLNSDQESVMTLAETLRSSVEALQMPHIGASSGKVVTVSVGASMIGEDHWASTTDFRESVDYALYQAQHHGRNRVYFTKVTSELV